MIFPWSHRDAGRVPMNKGTLTSRYSDFQRMITDGKNLQAKGEEYIATLRQLAREDGLAKEFHELEHPRAPETPRWEETRRVRVLKQSPPVSAMNPYHVPELYHAGIEPVPRTTELRIVHPPTMAPTD